MRITADCYSEGLGSFVGRVAGRGIGLGAEQAVNHGALAVGKLTAEACGIDDLLALIRGHLAKIEDGASNGTAAGNGKGVQLLDGSAELVTLLRGEALEGFVAIENPRALLRIHAIKASQLIAETLLGLRRQFVETRELLQVALLVSQGKIAVASHPLRDMLLARGGATRGTGWFCAVGLDEDGGRRILLASSAGERRHGREQQNERRAEEEPGWTMLSHIGCGAPKRTAVASGG